MAINPKDHEPNRERYVVSERRIKEKTRLSMKRSNLRISAPPLIELDVSLLDPIRPFAFEVAGLESLARLVDRHGVKLASYSGPSPRDFERLAKSRESGSSRTPAPRVENLPFENDA